MNNLDKQYIELINHVLETGYRSGDRTGTGTIKTFGNLLSHDMQEGFPLLTTKKMFTKGIIHELLWFLKGDTNIKYLVDNNVYIWVGDCYKKYKEFANSLEEPDYFVHVDDPNQNCTRIMTEQEFIDAIKTNDAFAAKFGELNKVYGAEWTNWEEHINQIQELIDTLKTNPDSRRMLVTAWNPTNVRKAVLPPCFIKDTIIDTNNGYKKIQDITIDDKLLTNDNTYQNINKIYKTLYTETLYELKPFYIPKITSTPNHPFLVKTRDDIIKNEYNTYREDNYTNVEDIDLTKENNYIAININTNNLIYTHKWYKKHKYGITEQSQLLNNKKIWYTLGYYLGDGYFIDSNKKVYFCIANKDIDKVFPIINSVVKIYPIKNSGINVTKFECKNTFIFDLVQKFGKYAHGKFIPEFVHDLPNEYLEEFLQGYFDADGHYSIKDNRIMYTTVSDSIAYGIQKIYAKLGKVCSISYSIKNDKKELLGRICNQRNTYTMCVSNNTNTNNYIFTKNYLWLKINTIDILKNHNHKYVYNFDVGKNHTYTVNNVINHNCHYAFQCFTRELSLEERIEIYGIEKINKNDNGYYEHSYAELILNSANIPTREISLMFNMRSVDVGLGLPFDIASYGFLLSMIAAQVNMKVGELKFILADTHIYVNQIDGLKEQVTREPMKLPKLKLNPDVKSIFDYTFDDIEIVDYVSHDKIFLPLSN